jgi:hypothetical protein
MIPGTFSHPVFLWPALGLAALSLLLGLWAQTRPGLGVRVVGQLPLLQALGLAFVLLGAGIGLAEPRWGTPEVPRLTVRVVLDASRSMQVRDMPGPRGKMRTRWEAATATLDRLWSQPNPGVLFSLDLLTGDAIPLLPPGEDLRLLRDAPRAVTPGEVGSPGTSLGRGLAQVAGQAAAKTPEMILLVSDGEETWEAQDAAMRRCTDVLAKARLPLYVLAVGQETKQPVAPPPGSPETVLFSEARPAFLAALAQACGGRVLVPGDNLAGLFQDLAQGRAPMPMSRSRLPAHPEAGAWLALTGICLWLAAAGKPMRSWRPWLLALFFLGAAPSARAGVPLPQTLQAWLAQNALDRGDLEAARKWKPRGDLPFHRLLRAEIELRSKANQEALGTLADLTGQGAPRPLPPWRAPALLMAARACMELGRPQDARSLLERLLLEAPGREEAVHNLQTLPKDPGPPPPNPKKPPPPPPSQAARQDELEGLKQRLPPKPPGGVKDL